MALGPDKTPEISYGYSPYQQQAMGAISPVINRAMSGQSYQVPDLPQMYDLPSTTGLTPNQEWYASLAGQDQWGNVTPGAWGGIDAPYRDALAMLSQLPGMDEAQYHVPSGSINTAQSALGAEAEQLRGLQAWNMTAPGYAQDFAAQLGANQAGYGAQMEGWLQNLAAMQYPYQTLASIYGGVANEPMTAVHPSDAAQWSRGLLSGVGSILSTVGQMKGGGMGGGGGMNFGSMFGGMGGGGGAGGGMGGGGQFGNMSFNMPSFGG